jgi:hypothetical protein
MTTLTTLQLARAIADAALDAHQWDGQRRLHDALDPPTQAVLETLRETGHWFCQLDETPTRTNLHQLALWP